jgi:hypothetical protein
MAIPFTVIGAPGAATLVEAARAASDPYVLLLATDATPLPDAFGGVRATLHQRLGVLGGATHAEGMRRFGWMLAPAPFSPLPFELVAVEAALGEAGIDPLVRGPLDALAPDMVLVRRELLVEPLPADPVAFAVALAARARAAGFEVACRPAFACTAPPPSRDDRGRAAALAALARTEDGLVGVHRQPPAARRLGIDRETPVPGKEPVRVRRRIPPTTVLVYGAGATEAARRVRDRSPAIVAARAVEEPVAALRAEMRVRGDRYVLVAAAAALPAANEFEALVEALESAAHVALARHAAPDDCALIAVGRLPQHVEAEGTSLGAALDGLACAALQLRRGVRPHLARFVPPPRSKPSASLVFLAGSVPDVTRASFDAALAAMRPGDELFAVCAAGAETTARMVGALPEVRLELDAVDPLLTDGANRAIAAARGDLIVVLADDVVAAPGWLDAVRAAFVRLPILGAALPNVGASPGGEGLHEVSYRDLTEMRVFAERRAASFAREMEPIDDAATPAIVVSRRAFEAVGGIDPAFGPTRRGIGDLVLRVRAAGYEVVRCEDAYVHRLDAKQSGNAAAASVWAQGAPDATARVAAIAHGFDPARRVPFVVPRVVREHVERATVLVVPIADALEVETAAAFLAAAAARFDARSPVRVDIVLDGPVTMAEVVARIRAVLAQSGRPIEETLAVRIERTADLTAWVAGLEPQLRVFVAASHVRPTLAATPVMSAHALGTLLAAAEAR